MGKTASKNHRKAVHYKKGKTELLIRKAETLPTALFEEAVHYIDYLSQKAQSAYFAEKLTEAEHEADKPNALWLDESEFWNEND